MPHITLEYSSNLPQLANMNLLFEEIHQALHSIGGIKLENCKSRMVAQECYFIGDGDQKNAFIHLQVEFIEGRSAGVKQALGKSCLALLLRYYDAFLSSKLQITVKIEDIARDYYFKYPEGSLTHEKK